MLRDLNWYNANGQRPWPLDDSALLLDDSGQIVPNDLLVDINLRFPRQYGDSAYVGTIYSGPGVVTILVLSENDDLLASLSVPRSTLEVGRQLTLTPIVPGVGGWAVLGEGVLTNTAVNLRFSSAEQSRLLPQVARAYARPSVFSSGKLAAATSLQGLVKLTAGNDVSIDLETLTINGSPQTAVVFSLSNTQDDVTRNLSTIYAGPCGGRPESRTCDGPQPIEAINTVVPDCCGNIFLEFRGCADISRVQNAGMGIVVDCGVGLGDACVTPARLPDSSGRLPNEYQDQCDPAYLERVPQGVDYQQTTTTTPAPAIPTTTTTSEPPLAGEIDIVIPNSPSLLTSTVVFDAPHGMIPGNKFTISGNSIAYYDVLHTVISIDSPTMLVSSVPYIADGEGGTWLKIL